MATRPAVMDVQQGELCVSPASMRSEGFVCCHALVFVGPGTDPVTGIAHKKLGGLAHLDSATDLDALARGESNPQGINGAELLRRFTDPEKVVVYNIYDGMFNCVDSIVGRVLATEQIQETLGPLGFTIQDFRLKRETSYTQERSLWLQPDAGVVNIFPFAPEDYRPEQLRFVMK